MCTSAIQMLHTSIIKQQYIPMTYYFIRWKLFLCAIKGSRATYFSECYHMFLIHKNRIKDLSINHIYIVYLSNLPYLGISGFDFGLVILTKLWRIFESFLFVRLTKYFLTVQRFAIWFIWKSGLHICLLGENSNSYNAWICN